MSNLFNYKNDYKKRNGRLFYEIWGDLEAQNTTLKIIIVLMTLITSASLLTAFYTYKANRIPVVIRVNSAGNAKVLRNLPFNNKTGMGEIVYFSKSFVREFTGFNSIMIKTELSRALNKMSEAYGKKTLRAVIRSRFVQKMEKADITSKIKFKKINLIKQTVNHDELNPVNSLTKLFEKYTISPIPVLLLNGRFLNTFAFPTELTLITTGILSAL